MGKEFRAESAENYHIFLLYLFAASDYNEK